MSSLSSSSLDSGSRARSDSVRCCEGSIAGCRSSGSGVCSSADLSVSVSPIGHWLSGNVSVLIVVFAVLGVPVAVVLVVGVVAVLAGLVTAGS